MKKANHLILVSVVLTLSVLSVLCLAFGRAKAQNGCLHLEVEVTALNDSGVTGTAVVDIGQDGLRGELQAQGLTPGDGYTVWLFYQEGMDVGGPGRFDSDVAEDADVTFHGRVGGLRVSKGATVKLLVFDHPDLGSTNVTRAANLLTPAGGSAVAQAVFTIP